MVSASSGGLAVGRPPEEVFDFLADVDSWTEFFAGLTRWEPLDPQRTGVGARYRVLLEVASVEVGGVVRITEWRWPRRIAWEWETGVRQHGGWTLTPLPTGTGVDLTLSWSLGGPVAWVVERSTRRLVAHNLRATVLGVRRRLEHPEIAAWCRPPQRPEEDR